MAATYFTSVKAHGSQHVQHIPLSLLHEEQAKICNILSQGTFACNSTKLTSVLKIAYNLNVQFAQNDPFLT